MDIANRYCLVTGATGVIGRAIALAMARMGADCVCHYHTQPESAENLVGQLAGLGRKAVAIQADLREPEQIDVLLEKAFAFGPIRILINSAAMFGRRKLSEITPQTARTLFDTNLLAPLLLSQGLVKRLTRDGDAKAKIINIADVGGLHPWAGYAEYCASKAGLIAMTQSLAKELAPQVTVNAIAPGIVTWHQPPEHPGTQKQLMRIPLGRFARPEEIAEAVLYLIKNDYVTGQVIQVDGGCAI